MTEPHRWSLPKHVQVGDITVRDGLQTLEHYVPADEKVRLAEDLILCGFPHIEVSNFGHPRFLPQFKDVEEVLDRLFDSERAGDRLKQNGGETTICCVTINERAVDRALEYKARKGRGPDYILQMVSTDEHHHRVNSGMSVEDYFKMSERCIQKAKQADVKMCGTVSTIWGSPIRGSRVTPQGKAVEYSRIYLDIGADYIEQADHDGSADPARVYEYFRMILDPEIMGEWSDPKYHLAHFHTSRGMGLANYLAALQAGVVRFETTLGGTGGQPSNKMDGILTGGTGGYYHFEHLFSGLVNTEDFVVMLEAMGVGTGVDVLALLDLGRRFREETLAISPAELSRMLENVSATTGIEPARLARLERDQRELDELIDLAVKSSAPEDEKSERRAYRNMEGLLRGLVYYLQTRSWGPHRSEAIISGVPPSPHLAHLIR